MNRHLLLAAALAVCALSTLAQAQTYPERAGFEAVPSNLAEVRARLEAGRPRWAQLVRERGISAE